jgi:hypothetical protein
MKPLFFLIVCVVLLLMSLKSRRFMEYFPPFAVAFGAFTITSRLERVSYAWLRRSVDRLIAATAAAAVTIVSAATMVVTVYLARAEIKEEPSPYSYRGSSQYVASHAAAGSMIFNTNWDAFPALFYYNPDYAYVAGLDPSYLYDRDHELWKLYEDITNGDRDDAAKMIGERFGAEYVVTGNGDSDFLSAARDDNNFEVVYEDRDAVVLRVRGPDEPRPGLRESNESKD